MSCAGCHLKLHLGLAAHSKSQLWYSSDQVVEWGVRFNNLDSVLYCCRRLWQEMLIRVRVSRQKSL